MPQNSVRVPFALPALSRSQDIISTVEVITYKAWWVTSPFAWAATHFHRSCIRKEVLTRRAVSDRKSINICLINCLRRWMIISKCIWTAIGICFSYTTDSSIVLPSWSKIDWCASRRSYPAHLCSTDVCRCESWRTWIQWVYRTDLYPISRTTEASV